MIVCLDEDSRLNARFVAQLIFGAMLGAAANLSPAAELAAPLPPGTMMAFDSPQEKEGDIILMRYLQASKKNIVRSVTMAAKFAGSLPGLGRSAVIQAKRKITNTGTIEYDVTAKDGDSTVQKELIARFMAGEIDSALKDTSRVAIVPQNYKFKYKGLREKSGDMVYVFEVNPRKKREGLFKGEIWLDSETALAVKETGRFVKSPSVFLKKVEFAREYTIKDGYSIPTGMQTSMETRFWGRAELDVQFSNIEWDGGGVMYSVSSPAEQSTPR